MKYTQIIATLSPKSGTKEMLAKMIDGGMDVVRLNFSHGTKEEHLVVLNNAREVAKEKNKEIKIIQDLSGPKIRTGELETDSVILEEGAEIFLTNEEVVGNSERIFVNYPSLLDDVNIGENIYLNDGKQQLQVLEKHEKELKCRIIVGGKITAHRGVNLPDTQLSTPSLTKKDKKDLNFGIENNVDYIAMSFVRNDGDIDVLRSLIKEKGGNQKIITKIETRQAIEDIDDIIEKSDGIMVARGDLSVEIGMEKVPFWQEKIIKKSNQAKKPVIVATHMLESMITESRPTRAEVADVENAVSEGADAVMLSGETAVGKHPDLAVETMNKIVIEAEKQLANKPCCNF